MSNFFQQLFGGGKKQVAPALKETPSLSSIAEYPLYRKTLEDRMAGIGLGFDPNVLKSNTAPYAAQRRASLKEQEIPLISAEASSRGLGRSTVPVNRVAASSQAAERDIEERIAQLTLENERQKATEKQNAITGYGGLLGTDYGAEVNKVMSQNEMAKAAAEAENTNANTYNKMMQNVGLFTAGMVSPIASQALTGLAGKVGATDASGKALKADWGKAISDAFSGTGSANVNMLKDTAKGLSMQDLIKFISLGGF